MFDTTSAGIIRRGAWLVLGSAVLWAAGCALDAGSAPSPAATDTVTRAIQSAAERVIPIHFVSFAKNCTGPSWNDLRTAVGYANEVYGEAGVQFSIDSFDHIPIAKDNTETTATWSDLAPIAQALGVSCSNCSGTKKVEYWLLENMTPRMPTSEHEKLVVFWGCGGGGLGGSNPMGAVISGANQARHEFGHALGLAHTFEVSTSETDASARCAYWDLVYAALGRGKKNRYFKSLNDCLGYALPSGAHIFKVDPRDPDPTEANPNPDKEQNGSPRKFPGDGTMIAQEPRCIGCTAPFDAPDDGVEQYTCGDWQIAGMERFTGGYVSGENDEQIGANSMGYCSKCLSDDIPGAHFISASQIGVIRSRLRLLDSGQHALAGRSSMSDPLRKVDFIGNGLRSVAVWRAPNAPCKSASSCPRGDFLTADGYRFQLGIMGDIPITGDYDGDGLTDPAVFRPGGGLRELGTFDDNDDSGYFIYCPSSRGFDCRYAAYKKLGKRTDVPIPDAFFDGNAATNEVALYTPSTGTWTWSTMCVPPTGASGWTDCASTVAGTFVLGGPTSELVPGLYDGDLKTDIAVFDRDTATFTMLRSELGWQSPVKKSFASVFDPNGNVMPVPMKQLRRYWLGDHYEPRVTFSLWDGVSGVWYVDWYWWQSNAPVACATDNTPEGVPLPGLDIDGDMFGDYATLDHDGKWAVWWKPNTCSGGWQKSTGSSTGRFAYSVRDVFGDGKPDIVIDDLSTNGQLTVLDSANNYAAVSFPFGSTFSEPL